MKNIILLLLMIPFMASAHGHPDDTRKLFQDTYTCPMHPEVKSSKPGNCPKCGMRLEKKKTVAKPKPAATKAPAAKPKVKPASEASNQIMPTRARCIQKSGQTNLATARNAVCGS